jgi:Fe-S-cluster-containing dehydrogenase component
MARYGIAIDVSKCVGCYNCFLTCRDEHAGNDYPGYTAPQPLSGGNWIKVKEIERGTYPHVKVNHVSMTCNHCDSAACIKLDQTGAIYRRPDGIVIIDPVKAKGNKELVNTCPYRRIEWNAELELPQKCTMCAHLLDAGEPEPRCVESCPSGALTFGDLDDPNSAISKLAASGDFKPLNGEYNMGEKVLYRKIPKKFVAGTVIYGDIDEVAKDIEVVLDGPDSIQTTVTNGFGDFEFEDLPENTNFTVKIQAPGYKQVTLTAKTSRDVYLGEIVLVK